MVKNLEKPDPVYAKRPYIPLLTRTMHTKSNSIEIIIGSETNEITEDLFESFLQKYRERLEESMRESEFVYDSVDVLYYNLNKVSLSRGE